jgi:DegV family protein with EDD domain
MSSIAIITDTDSDLPEEIAARYNIRQVPITVHFGDEVLETGVDINNTQLFERIDREGELPTTAAPSPGKFALAYQSAFDEGAESVICFCVSGEVSATYGAAVAACDEFPERDISVVDTRTLSMAQGFMALTAAEAVEKGASKERAIQVAKDMGSRTHLYASLSTLKYLAMSGRVGHLVAGMANILNVKPILTIQEGKLDLLERVRTQKKATARVIELAAQAAENKSIERMAIIHICALEEAREFEAKLHTRMACCEDILYTELSAGLSVHAGAGLVGVVFVVGESSE